VSTLRRSAALTLIALATVLGLTTGTAAATYNAQTTMTATVGTTTVAAPTAVTAQMTSCSSSRTQSVQLTWTASTSARVSGYTIAVLDNAGNTLGTGQVGPTTSATINIDKLSANPSALTYSVTTLTDYGWTATSPRKAALPC
jgi:hypothetical protein